MNEAIKVYTRRGHDWSKCFRKVADDAWHIGAGSAIIDGEIVVPAANGTTDFSILQNELKGKSTKIVLIAFDLLYLNGYDLRKLPLIERKKHLKKKSTGATSSSAKALKSMGRRCSHTPAKLGSKESLQRSATAFITQGGAAIGSRKRAPSARR